MIGHAHHLIGHAVCFLFVLIAGLADREFGLDETPARPCAERAPDLCEWMFVERGGRRRLLLIWLRGIGCLSLHAVTSPQALVYSVVFFPFVFCPATPNIRRLSDQSATTRETVAFHCARPTFSVEFCMRRFVSDTG